MEKHQKKFLIKLSLLSLFLGLLGVALFSTMLKSYYQPIFPLLLLFNLLVNYFVYSAVTMRIHKSPVQFNNVFMISNMSKLIVYMVVLLVYILLNKAQALQFAVAYLMLYFIYTFYEVKALVDFVNKHKAGQN